MHPYHLQALTAAHSLTNARWVLTDLRLRQRPVDDARDGLRSPVLGRRHSLGGWADPVATIALTPSTRRDELAELDQHVTDTLRRLAGELHGDPLAALTRAIPELAPHHAADLGMWLADLDQRIRDVVGVPTPTASWPGDCPACGQRLLTLHLAAPTADQTVTCDAEGCACTGDNCPCRMPTRVAGVAHIWPRAVLAPSTDLHLAA